MTSKSASMDRNSLASEARLKLYVHLLSSVRDIKDYETAREIRDRLTRWAPWAIKLRIWDQLYDALSSPEKHVRFRHLLDHTSESLNRALKREDGEVSPELFGDVSEDVRHLTLTV